MFRQSKYSGKICLEKKGKRWGCGKTEMYGSFLQRNLLQD